ncbi:conjugal transfer protein [Streptococcus sp. H49]|uniref:conjugal transfer protein n=1 Tax=Streptococcus huangxiaojuni TaxID=3237239 RepID=UPI0034A3F34F
MAKVGLNFGDKLQIVDKSYRVISDGLVDPKEVFGELTWRGVEELDVIYEDDTSQPRRQDGTYPQISTGEIRGVVVGIHSSLQHQTLFFTIIDQAQAEIEALGLEYRKPVDLENIVITYASVGNNNYKLFASKVIKPGNKAKVDNEQPKDKK